MWNTSRVGGISRTSSSVYQDLQKSVDQIGKELDVDYIVEGSVRRSESTYRVTVMLIRVNDQAHLWAENYDRPVDKFMSLHVELAKIISSEIASRIHVEADSNSHVADPLTPEASGNTISKGDASNVPRKDFASQSRMYGARQADLLNQAPPCRCADLVGTVPGGAHTSRRQADRLATREQL